MATRVNRPYVDGLAFLFTICATAVYNFVYVTLYCCTAVK
ncbi:hypothetical protein CLCAR_3423 [Clostridium carboxidivorans P7]|nr:hypothetical protein CLCAR_3423 [Clostridium carboxidivorans P7]